MKIIIDIPDKYLEVAKVMAMLGINNDETMKTLGTLLDQARKSEQPLTISTETVEETGREDIHSIYTLFGLMAMLQLGKDNDVE